MRTRKQHRDEPIAREAIQGFACRCEACLGKPFIEEIFCARCGHGYIDLRTGRADDANMGCTKCGAVGQFVDERPALPEPPDSWYRVRLRRVVYQETEVVCTGHSQADALDRARRMLGDKDEWEAVEDSAARSVITPVSVTEAGRL